MTQEKLHFPSLQPIGIPEMGSEDLFESIVKE